MHPDNLADRTEFGLRYGFGVFTGAHYLGSFIGDDGPKHGWIEYHTPKWEKHLYDKKNVGEAPPG